MKPISLYRETGFMDSNKQEIATSLQFCKSAVVPFSIHELRRESGHHGLQKCIGLCGATEICLVLAVLAKEAA